jgi:hypothetical protein
VDRVRRRGLALVVAAGVSYVGLGVLLWGEAWTQGASTHTLCGCGDPALFLWFFQWPATALAHGHSPFYSSALFHPGGTNLLAQTSVLGLSVPLIPVTWIWGPVASLNVASTLAPALSAFFCFVVLRRWVRWMPAAYLGGLLYGFSPFVLTSLQFAHLMTAALMLLPLILAVLDDIVVRQRHSARWGGVALGVLLAAQFFISSELLAVVALLVVAVTLVLVGVTLVVDRAALRARLPHALESIVMAAVVGGVLLIYPVWFALDGRAHLPGLIWPNIGAIGGYNGSSFVTGGSLHGSNLLTGGFTGYEGTALPSSAYLGWGLLIVLALGLLVWFRDRRIVFFGFLLAFCVAISLGERKGNWVPARVFAHLPVLENVIVQRFMAVGFLAAAVMLALILDKARYRLPRMLDVHGVNGRAVGVGAAVGLAAVALLPMAETFAPTMPFAMRPVLLPRWYTAVAPNLPAGRVVLTYPTPFSGIQSSMAWQAVDAMHFSQAGGGGPQGTAVRAGAARAGFVDLTYLAFGITVPQPSGTAANYAAVRHALALWQVNTVVIAPDRAAPLLQQGHDPEYAAAFMTGALGRLPTIEAGAWVWNNVSLAQHAALKIKPSVLPRCVAVAEKRPQGHRFVPGSPATMKVADCVGLAALS